ncbi:MAG: cytochrome P450 [Agrobacterium tumefaciens]
MYLQFLAHALHMHPPGIPDTSAGARHREAFVQEVRRYYPFFPAVAAVVRESFEWKGYRFAKGRRVMLDLYGTNRDRRTWDAPGEFRPERFDGIQPRPLRLRSPRRRRP